MKATKKVPGVLKALAGLALVLCVFTAFSNVNHGRQAQDKAQLERSVRRAAVACYAAEGIYPPDLAYLQQHYGVQVDGERFTVMYEVFGSNLMPDITVLELE